MLDPSRGPDKVPDSNCCSHWKSTALVQPQFDIYSKAVSKSSAQQRELGNQANVIFAMHTEHLLTIRCPIHTVPGHDGNCEVSVLQIHFVYSKIQQLRQWLYGQLAVATTCCCGAWQNWKANRPISVICMVDVKLMYNLNQSFLKVLFQSDCQVISTLFVK